EKAIDFPNWLIPFQDITTALNLTVSTLPNGELEIKGVGLIKRIKISELTSDPELGLTISIAQIEELLQVRSKFDIVAYSIILEPPWLNFKGKKTTNQNLR
ncbi:MAG: carboxypeptidase regulatory-like domain-containing protein, partial [Aphanizomenon sp.]